MLSRPPRVRHTSKFARRLFIICLGLVCSGIFGCALLGDGVPEGEVVIAEVGDQRLFLSEVTELVPSRTPAADSLRILQDYIGRWAVQAALTEEAITNGVASAEIDRLVSGYRASLLRHRYEEKLLASGVDSVITQEQLQAIYRETASDYPAERPILRATLYKFADPQPEAAAFREAWYGDLPEDEAAISALADQHAELSLRSPNTWYELTELSALLPDGQLSSAQAGRRVVSGDGYVYYLNVLELVRQGEPTPLGYLEERLKKALLEQRRGEFLANAKQRIFERAQARDDIKIYLGNE